MSVNNAALCAVVVCFRPDLNSLRELVKSILPQVGGLVIINNGLPGTLLIPSIEEAAPGRYKLLDMGRNRGVGSAQNCGILWAKEHGFSHVILFDQDSKPSADMVEKLVAASSKLKRDGIPVAAVGPRLFDRRDGAVAPFVRFGLFRVRRIDFEPNGCIRTDFLISSGMLAEIAIYDRVGLLDEDLFIDNTDLDWCFRAQRQGLFLFGIYDADMLHQIGDSKIEFSIFGLHYRIYRHTPVRQYYIMRNRILLYRRSHSPTAWIVQDIFRALGKTIFMLLYLPERTLNFQMMLKGAIDGIRGRNGEYSK